eukprot:g398.t1
MIDIAVEQIARDLAGHNGAKVVGVSFTSDGCELTSVVNSNSNGGSTIKVWDVKSSELISDFEGFDEPIYSLGISPHDVLVAGLEDGSLQIFDPIASLECGIVDGVNDGEIKGLCFANSGDDVLLVAVGYDEFVHVLGHPEVDDTENWPIKAELEGHDDGIDCVSASSDGSLIATGSRDQTVKIWSFNDTSNTGKCLVTLDIGDDVTDVALNSEGSMLATAAFDKSTVLWKVAKNQSDSCSCTKSFTLAGHTSYVWQMHFLGGNRTSGDIAGSDSNGDGGVLITAGSYDCTIRMWSPASGEELACVDTGSYAWSLASVALSCDDSSSVFQIACGLEDGIKCWKVTVNKSIGKKRNGEKKSFKLLKSEDSNEKNGNNKKQNSFHQKSSFVEGSFQVGSKVVAIRGTKKGCEGDLLDYNDSKGKWLVQWKDGEERFYKAANLRPFSTRSLSLESVDDEEEIRKSEDKKRLLSMMKNIMDESNNKEEDDVVVNKSDGKGDGTGVDFKRLEEELKECTTAARDSALSLQRTTDELMKHEKTICDLIAASRDDEEQSNKLKIRVEAARRELQEALVAQTDVQKAAEATKEALALEEDKQRMTSSALAVARDSGMEAVQEILRLFKSDDADFATEQFSPENCVEALEALEKLAAADEGCSDAILAANGIEIANRLRRDNLDNQEVITACMRLQSVLLGEARAAVEAQKASQEAALKAARAEEAIAAAEAAEKAAEAARLSAEAESEVARRVSMRLLGGSVTAVVAASKMRRAALLRRDLKQVAKQATEAAEATRKEAALATHEANAAEKRANQCAEKAVKPGMVFVVAFESGVAWRTSANYEERDVDRKGPNYGCHVKVLSPPKISYSSRSSEGIIMVHVIELCPRGLQGWLPMTGPSGEILLQRGSSDADIPVIPRCEDFEDESTDYMSYESEVEEIEDSTSALQKERSSRRASLKLNEAALKLNTRRGNHGRVPLPLPPKKKIRNDKTVPPPMLTSIRPTAPKLPPRLPKRKTSTSGGSPPKLPDKRTLPKRKSENQLKFAEGDIVKVDVKEGIAWRNTALYTDRKMTRVGPSEGTPLLVVDDCVLDGKSGVVMVPVREAWGRNIGAWLPSNTSDGKIQLLSRYNGPDLGRPFRVGDAGESEDEESSSYESYESYDEEEDEFDENGLEDRRNQRGSVDKKRALSRRMNRMSARIQAKQLENAQRSRVPPPLPAARRAAARSGQRKSLELNDGTEMELSRGDGGNPNARVSTSRMRPNSRAIANDWIVGQRDGVAFYLNLKTGKTSTKTPKELRIKGEKKKGFFSKLFRRNKKKRNSSIDEESEESEDGEYDEEYDTDESDVEEEEEEKKSKFVRPNSFEIARFQRMLKYGVPRAKVIEKMRESNFDPTALDNDVNTVHL